jgi:acyl-CoA thioester hydrolase
VVARPEPRGRKDFKAWRSFATRWTDNDVYGHVNNTVYYQWFDSAVNAWLIDHQLLNLQSGELIGLVVETRCSFFTPLTFPRPVEIGINVIEVGNSSVRYGVGIFDVGHERTAAHGEFTHVYVDRQTRRPVPLPEKWRETLESLA